jgi:hypothetical protein
MTPPAKREFVVRLVRWDDEEQTYRATVKVDGFESGMRHYMGSWEIVGGIGARWPDRIQAGSQIQAALNEIVKMMEGVRDE